MSRTVLVVGAGASCEIDFPSGEKLVEQIADITSIQYDGATKLASAKNRDFYRTVYDSFAAKFPGPSVKSDLFQSMQQLSEGVVHAQSIDNFLALHEGKEQLIYLGKLAIAYVIAKLEHDSCLYQSDNPIDVLFRKREMPISKWYGRFFKALTNECKPEHLPGRLQDLCIVCFNYDRNIEQYFLRAIRSLYMFSEAQAASALKNLTIWHPYGSLGDVPPLAATSGVPYGTIFSEYEDASLFSKTAARLRTFSEGATDLNVDPASRVRNFFKRSDRFIFLGFGFLPANMELLRRCCEDVSEAATFSRKVFGTCYGASEFDRGEYTAQLAEILHANPSRVFLSKTTCADIFQEYSGALRFGHA